MKLAAALNGQNAAVDYLRGLFDVPDALRRAPLRSITHRRHPRVGDRFGSRTQASKPVPRSGD